MLAANKIVLAMALAVFLSLNACVSTDYSSQKIAGVLQYNADLMRRYQIDENWWRIYNDSQLNALVETALKNNPDLAMSAIAVNKALYQANLLDADLVPEFSGGLEAAASRDIKGDNATQQNFSADLRVGYELDLWQRLRDRASAQEWEYMATTKDLLATRLVLINSVVDAYFNLYYLHNSMLVTRQSIDNYRQIQKITGIKYQEGKVSSLEPAQAAQSLLMYENNLLELETQYKNAEQTLRNLLNLKPQDKLALVYGDMLKLGIPEVDLDVPLMALANRPDLQAAEYRLNSALASLSAAQKSWYPTVTIGASINSASERAQAIFDLPFTGGYISVNLPFLQWNRIKWQVKISEAEFESMRIQFEQSINKALNEVDYHYYAYGKNMASLAKVREKYQYDLKISAYYKTRYENGASELADWLAALNTSINSQLSLLKQRYQVIRQENMLYRAMAGRYQKAPAN